MVKNKIVRIVITYTIMVVILIGGLTTQRIPLALGIVIGMLVILVNYRLLIRDTLRGLRFDTRKKMLRYYFLSNLLRYSGVVFLLYLIYLTKKINFLGIILGLAIGILLILLRIY